MKLDIKKILLTLVGTFLLAFSVELFILPNNILTGGVAGITIIICNFFKGLNENVANTVINTILFIVGAIFLGKEFTYNTAISSITYPAMIFIINYFVPKYSINPLLAAIYGGVIGGLGVGIVIRQGGSTGGMDVPPLIMEKFFNISVSSGIMVTDLITVSFGLYLFGFEEILVGLVSVFCTSAATNWVMNSYGGVEGKKIEIISDEYEAINNEIIKLDRGTTIVNSKGGFTGNEKPMIMTVVLNNQYDLVMKIIDKYDKNAFVIVSDIRDVHGEGFTFEPRI